MTIPDDSKSDADADVGKEKIWVRSAPQRGSQRAIPCTRCVRLRRDCYEQMNGKQACWGCGKGKVRWETEGAAPAVVPKVAKGPGRKKVKKAHLQTAAPTPGPSRPAAPTEGK